MGNSGKQASSNTQSDKGSLALWITMAVLLAGVALAVALAIYFLSFHGGLSNDQAVWGQFGDFLGGTVNPILGFLTIIALALTLILQNRQLSISATELALSREELRLTREELGRSAQAQELSEQALRAQAATAERSARLTATNYLLEHYRTELSAMMNRSLDRDMRRRYDEMRARKEELNSLLDSLFDEIVQRPEG